MHDEVAKHTQKIYHTIKDPQHDLWSKTKEVFIEIFIIVFAVTLSIWLHNWSDHRHEQQETKEFLNGLKDDLNRDIRLMEENKTTLSQVNANFTFITMLNKNKTIDTASDRLISSHLYFSLVGTHPNIGRYEGFKSSGKIGTIENDSLKQCILEYYQQTMPGIDDIENVANSFQTRVMELEVQKTDATSMKALAKTFQMRSLLQFGTQNITSVIKAYDNGQQQARKIIAMINEENR